MAFELDKEQFGVFLSTRRREKGYTQKDLANRLFVSDKAVSKWERGQSLPDISLLVPLAECLDVTVTELLEGQRLGEASLPAGQVEELLKKTLALSDDRPEREQAGRGKRFFVLLAAAMTLLLESVAYFGRGDLLDVLTGGALFFSLMALGFGVYFWLIAPARIPGYYDENRINAYSDGPFRMNLPGVAINNSNWPHILRAMRIWSVAATVGTPLTDLVMGWTWPTMWNAAGRWVLLALFLGGLFLPTYAAAKRYE